MYMYCKEGKHENSPENKIMQKLAQVGSYASCKVPPTLHVKNCYL